MAPAVKQSVWIAEMTGRIKKKISCLFSVLRFFLEYQWLVDFAVYATGVFLFTECYYSVVDASKEVNIGAIWCVLTVLFGLYPSTVWLLLPL